MSRQLPTNYQQYIHISRYSRWVEELGRRETWEETITRLMSFWKSRLDSQISDKDLKDIEEAILNLNVMPSMRSLMTAGAALTRDEVAGYNCAFTVIDNPRCFDEIMYVLMCGTGMGFSVERQYVSKLPEVAEEFHYTDTTIVVSDSKLGWASALRELISLLYSGKIPKWDISKIREAGARLKTFGGRASGPRPLEDLFKFTVDVFTKAKGRRLSSIECHDLVCKIAEIVVVGGVRRCCFENYFVLQGDGNWKMMKDIEIGDTVSIDGKEYNINNVFDNGVQKTVNVKMADGTTHQCTPEHRWYVYNHDVNEAEWVQAQYLSDGNYSMLKPKAN